MHGWLLSIVGGCSSWLVCLVGALQCMQHSGGERAPQQQDFSYDLVLYTSYHSLKQTCLSATAAAPAHSPHDQYGPRPPPALHAHTARRPCSRLLPKDGPPAKERLRCDPGLLLLVMDNRRLSLW